MSTHCDNRERGQGEEGGEGGGRGGEGGGEAGGGGGRRGEAGGAEFSPLNRYIHQQVGGGTC